MNQSQDFQSKLNEAFQEFLNELEQNANEDETNAHDVFYETIGDLFQEHFQGGDRVQHMQDTLAMLEGYKNRLLVLHQTTGHELYKKAASQLFWSFEQQDAHTNTNQIVGSFHSKLHDIFCMGFPDPDDDFDDGDDENGDEDDEDGDEDQMEDDDDEDEEKQVSKLIRDFIAKANGDLNVIQEMHAITVRLLRMKDCDQYMIQRILANFGG